MGVACVAPGGTRGMASGYHMGGPSLSVAAPPARTAGSGVFNVVPSAGTATLSVMLEPSLDLYGDTFDKVDGILTDLLERSHARYVMIIDRNGFVLMHGRALWAPKPPSLDSLATLIASNYSANTAIANLFGEEGFRETVQQGADVGTYIEELGEKALLVTVFDSSAALGRVKLYTKKSVEEIRVILRDSREEVPVMEFDKEWSSSTEALLDGLFGSGKQ